MNNFNNFNQKLNFLKFYLLNNFFTNASFISSKFNSNYAPFLTNLCILPTYNCNLSCKMCPQRQDVVGRKNIAETYIENLKLEPTFLFIDKIAKWKPQILLTGGEPLLYKDLFKLADYIKKKNLPVFLQTNGFLLADFAQEIIKNFTSVIVSLQGDENTDSYITANKNHFKKTLTGIKTLNKIKKKLNNYFPLINISITISPDNYLKLYEFLQQIKELDFLNSIIFLHYSFIKSEELPEVFNSEIYTNKFSPLPMLLTNTEIKSNLLIQEIKKVKKEKYPFKIFFIPQFTFAQAKFYYGNTKHSLNQQKKCKAIYSSAYLWANGDIRICQGVKIGNICEDNLKKIWNGKKAIKFRREINKTYFPWCKNCYGLYFP